MANITLRDPNTAILGWKEVWGDAILQDFQTSFDPFEDVDPIIDTSGLGQSWNNMQEWANLSFQPPAREGAAPEDIECETMAAGGVRFGCYGMVSQSVMQQEFMAHSNVFKASGCFHQARGRYGAIEIKN